MNRKLKVLVISLVLVALIGSTAPVVYAQEEKPGRPPPRPWLSANATRELREAIISNITVANLLSAQAKQLAEAGDFPEAAELSSLSAEIAYKALITACIGEGYLPPPFPSAKGKPPFPPAKAKPALPPAKGKPPLPPAKGKAPPWWQFWRPGEEQPPLPPPAKGKPPLQPPVEGKPPLPPAKAKPPLPPR